MFNVTHTVNHLFQPLSVCLFKPAAEVQGLASEQVSLSLFTWILSGLLKRVCVCEWVPLCLSAKNLVPLRQSRSSFLLFCSPTRSVFPTFSTLSPKLLFYLSFSSSFLLYIVCHSPHFVAVSLHPTFSFLAPINHPPFFFFLLSWWASQEVVHSFEKHNLLFLPFAFPFQSSVHSWNQGAPHVDEQSWLFLERTFRQEMGRRPGGREGHRRLKNERLCDEVKQQLLTEGNSSIQLHCHSALHKCTEEDETLLWVTAPCRQEAKQGKMTRKCSLSIKQ